MISLKPVFIIAIAVVCSVVAVFGVLAVIQEIQSTLLEEKLKQQEVKKVNDKFCNSLSDTIFAGKSHIIQQCFDYGVEKSMIMYCEELKLGDGITCPAEMPMDLMSMVEQRERMVKSTLEPPSGPANAGALGSEHAHAAILVKIFGDEFDFSAPAYQIKSPWMHFESRDGTTIHKHATGMVLEYLFNSLSIGLDDQCYVFPDGKAFCTTDEYSLKYFINGESVFDIRDYEIVNGDKILITFGGETDDQIQKYLTQLDNQEIIS
jgi:hypothetical protein